MRFSSKVWYERRLYYGKLILCFFFGICWILILNFYNPFSGPTKFKTSVFFCSFSKFSKTALNFKENVEIFHLQRPQNFFLQRPSKFFFFQQPHQIKKCLLFLLFLEIFHLQRPQNFFLQRPQHFSTFSGPKLFQPSTAPKSQPSAAPPNWNVCFFLFFFALSHNFQKSP